MLDFENVTGMTPLDLTSYANALNSSTTVPASARLSLQIGGLLFHSGGGSFNDPQNNPGTPTALLRLQGGIAGDAHSATNVVGSLEINSDLLDLDQFVEVGLIDGTRRNRFGFWLNPSLGPVLLSAFDANGSLLESGTGTAGNFVGIVRPTDEIRAISIVSSGAQGFTIDDLTFGSAAPSAVPEPGTLALLGTGLAGLGAAVRKRWKKEV